MSNELAERTNGTTLDLLSGSRDDIFRLGETLFQSGYFKDIKSGAQAIVKILRGAELGMGPIQSLENVYVVEGRTALSYPAIGAQIKKSVRYDYRVLTSNDTECEIAFFEQGKELGRERFTLKDAERALLLGKDNWKKYPKAMLFARALSAGARQYTPDVFGGTIYSVDELRDIKDPELAIDTPVQTVDTATGGEITEYAQRDDEAVPPRDVRVQAYRELTVKAGAWNADQAHEPIEHSLYQESWSDDELNAHGTALKDALTAARRAERARDARASVI